MRAAKIASIAAWASLPGASNWRSDEVLAPDAATPRRPEARLERGERDPAVRAGVRAVADEPARERVAAALRRRALAGELPRRRQREPRQRAVGHRDVDVLPLAAAVALAQRGEDRERGHERAAAEVGDLPRRLRGRPARLAGEPEQSGEGEVVEVVTGAVAQRAVLAVAGDRAQDDPRILRAQGVVAGAEAVEHARPEGLEHDVVLAHERRAAPRGPPRA